MELNVNETILCCCCSLEKFVYKAIEIYTHKHINMYAYMGAYELRLFLNGAIKFTKFYEIILMWWMLYGIYNATNTHRQKTYLNLTGSIANAAVNTTAII